ncbi:hypothetical protein JHL17_06475 [Azospirillum sp. YIM B02556]|uniref:Uncharacterized protein n=1 Tax=Azospirillum endophyticum TaxID=2800326 RepID=A0ABS1F0V5_9PROT|nr:hypothetical protein [Azospirillum endophyticum]MBK1837051.1 hypothetical protein [Azospirillum endophyticum]
MATPQSDAVRAGVVSAGMASGLIDDIRTCDDLIRRKAAGCRTHLRLKSVLAEG